MQVQVKAACKGLDETMIKSKVLGAIKYILKNFDYHWIRYVKHDEYDSLEVLNSNTCKNYKCVNEVVVVQVADSEVVRSKPCWWRIIYGM